MLTFLKEKDHFSRKSRNDVRLEHAAIHWEKKDKNNFGKGEKFSESRLAIRLE